MKKVIFLLFLFCFTTLCKAQLYSVVEIFDKFDDSLSKRYMKTLITKTDSTFIVETKGQKPVEYYYFEDAKIEVGRKDSIANLTADIWGYETHYYVVNAKQMQEVKNITIEAFKSLPEDKQTSDVFNSLKLMNFFALDTKLNILVFRTISMTPRYFTYQTEMAWIKNPEGERTIFHNDK